MRISSTSLSARAYEAQGGAKGLCARLHQDVALSITNELLGLVRPQRAFDRNQPKSRAAAPKWPSPSQPKPQRWKAPRSHETGVVEQARASFETNVAPLL